MTWQQLVARAAHDLHDAGIDDPQTNADYLALAVKGYWERSKLKEMLPLEASSEEEGRFHEFIARRIDREPLQYIIGEWEFFGLRLFTDNSALIPRPETELLVEEAIRESATMNGSLRVLDLGTGSGAILLAIASVLPHARCTGVDLSAPAISLADRNKARLGLENIQFQVGDMLSDAGLHEYLGTIDLLVSNPPYISRADWQDLEPELREHEPRMALTDEANGLSFYRRLIQIAPRLLSERGCVLLELGYDASEDVGRFGKELGVETVRIVKDLAGIPRVFVGRPAQNVVALTK